MTEAASQVATQSLDMLERRFENSPLPAIEGWEVRTNPLGRLQMCGPWLFTGYVELKDGDWEYSEGRDADGWFTTEDMGGVEVIEGKSLLTIAGRAGRTVKILGELVNLNPLEDMAVQFADEASELIALDVVDDERMGKRIVLVVERDVSKQQIQDLIERFNDRVAPFERLRGVARVDVIPRSPLGKIRRRKLAESLEDIVTW